jgi:hypothetical protein
MANREQNERRFPQWEDLPDGGRRYFRIVTGKLSGYARFVKVVNADEETISFIQEIYDDEGLLVGSHQKYPQDTGHQDVSVEEDSP